MKKFLFIVGIILQSFIATSQTVLPFTVVTTAPTSAAAPPAAPSQHIVSFYGSANVSSSDELIENIGSSQKLSAVMRLRQDGRTNVYVGFNNRGIRPSSIERDSLDLVSLMFPEAGNTGAMIGIQQFIYSHAPSTNRQHGIYLNLEGSYRQNKITTHPDSLSVQTIEFGVINVNLAANYQFCTNLTNDPFIFNFGLYYNYFNLPNEDAKSFSDTFTPGFIESNKNSFINSFGGKFSVTYRDFTLFADLRYNKRTGFLLDSNPLKGTVVNVGTIISTEIFHIP